jgi:hypothetical protein
MSSTGIATNITTTHSYLNEIMEPLINNEFYRNEDIPCRTTTTTSSYDANDPTTSINGTALQLIIVDGTTGTPAPLVTKTMAITYTSDSEVRGFAKLAIADLATLPVNSTVTLEYRVWATFPGSVRNLVERGTFKSKPALL